MESTRNFIEDTIFYARRMGTFERVDWNVYFAWVGLMMGLLFSVCGFFWVGYSHGVTYPAYVWNLPLGTVIFIVAISFDTIGHRSAYKQALKKGEALVHHITIAAGISSCVLLCLAYTWGEFLKIPALCLVALSVFYSIIDEGMHWFRFYQGNSDRIEMWSHFFIFVGHTIQISTWCYWFLSGYPGVKETVQYLPF
jgi:hypothetical protein